MKKLVYENIPIGAKANSDNSISHKQEFVNESDLKEELEVEKFATLEKTYWRLDGTFKLFPDNPQKLGYISTIMSDSNGKFSDDIVFTRTYDKKYSSPGFQIEFDTHENDYAKNIKIQWYRDNILIAEKSFEIGNANIFCQNNVEAFNKIMITFFSMNKPYRYLKIFNINDGIIQTFFKDSILNLKILEEVSTTSEQLSINTLTTNLLNKENFDLLFQKTLPINLYNDAELIGAFFIKASSKTNTYKVNCSDYIYILDNSEFAGGFFENVDAEIVFANILSGLPYEIADELKTKKINGYLQIQSRRKALQEAAFSIGAVVDCSRSKNIKIFKLNNEIVSEIENSRIFSIKETQETITTHILLTEHNYKLSEEKEELFNDVLTASTKIIFDSPITQLEIENGQILESNINYAIIIGNGSENTVLRGYAYTDTTTVVSKENTAASYIDILKEKKYDSTLINKANSSEIIENINFINKKLTVKFILGNERVGDVIAINNYTARIISLNFDLNSNIIVATANMEVLA